MITVKNGNKEVELKFGIGQLTAIDKSLGLEVEKINLGEGLEMLVPKLHTGNIIGLSKVISAASVGQKGRPKTDEELEDMLVSARNEYGSFKAFGKAIIDVLGERPLTQDLVKDAMEKLGEEMEETTAKEEVNQ